MNLRALSPLKTLTTGEKGLMALTLLYVVCGWALASGAGLGDRYRPVMYLDTAFILTKFLFLVLFLAWALRAFRVMIKVRPRRLTRYLIDDIKPYLLNREMYARAIPVFLCFIFFFSAFTSIKFMIPGIKPFAWDERLMHLDRVLHGGTDAWRFFHPLLGYRPVTLLVNFVYNFWILILYAVLYWQLFSLKNPLLRMRFFYAFMLTWAINGSLFAIYFSSAGPCYYQPVEGSMHFAPLMEYLEDITFNGGTIWAITTQQMLWENYESGVNGVGAGISAMPSVHVATAFLFMLLGLKSEKKFWRVISIAYLVFIQLGSVHLGWHYGIDGYFSMLTTGLIWVLTGFAAKAGGNERGA